MNRRSFVRASLTTTAVAALPASTHAAQPDKGRECYELRCYRFKPGASSSLLETYLGKALLPALQQRGIARTGVFTEVEVDRPSATAKPKPGSPVWVLIPHPTLESFVDVNTVLLDDSALRKAGAAYLETPKNNPAFERIDSWLYLAFTGMPRMELPDFCLNRAPGRFFEMRDYESHSELKALNKIAMFNEGETDLMRELGMSPLFFGQSLAGSNLPHLRYITCGQDIKSHFAHWSKFGPHPKWNQMKNDPRWADNTTKTGPSVFLVPTPQSTI